jgi:hypothetical protein
MMPATVLEAWAILYLDAAELEQSVRLSIDNQVANDLVEYYAGAFVADESRGKVGGPLLVGIAALAVTTLGMFLAVYTGAVSKPRPRPGPRVSIQEEVYRERPGI